MPASNAHLRLVYSSAAGPLPPERLGGTDQRLSVEVLYRQYKTYVAWLATRMLGRADEVDDLIHDVFLIAAGQLSKLRDPAAARWWLATITVRQARRKLRARRFKRLLGLDRHGGYEDLASHGASPEDRAVLTRLYQVLDRMPVAQRSAWVLRYVEREPMESVATLCRCSLAAAKRRIAAAQELLRKELGDG